MKLVSDWVENETKNVKLNDRRLAQRFSMVLDSLGNHPYASIPAACGGRNDMIAAYRFFDNAKVSFEQLLTTHVQATVERLRDQPVVLCVQDTTEIDLTRPEQQVEGAGYLDGSKRRGMFLHPTAAFTPNGVPLGVIAAEHWTRQQPPPGASKEERQRSYKKKPVEAKESMRWIRSYRGVVALQAEAPGTRFISIADSEADMYELVEEARETPENPCFIVRACQNRALQKSQTEEEGQTAEHLFEQAEGLPVLYTQTIDVRARTAPKIAMDSRRRRQSRKAREAELEVRATRVALRAPHRPDRKPDHVEVNVVFVQEIDPPEGVEPVQWCLLTNLPIDEPNDVYSVIAYYQVRWLIEIYFRTLKSSCRVESLGFESLDRFLPCLVIYMIAAWRAMYVCYLSRRFPEESCEMIFERSEWRSIYQFVHRRRPPDNPPTLRSLVRLIAGLGGYVESKSRTKVPYEPGPQTLSTGLQRLHDIAQCWDTFGPEAKNTYV